MKREDFKIEGTPQLVRIAAIARGGVYSQRLLDRMSSLAATVPESEKTKAGGLIESYIASWGLKAPTETEEGA